jgi:hypothetical protein
MRARLDQVLRTPAGIGEVSPRTGDLRPLLPERPNQSWPRRLGSHVYAAWHRGARVGVDCASDGGVASGEWSRKGTRATDVVRVGEQAVLRANEGALSALGPDLRATWEARVRTYVYGMAKLGEDDLVVGTTGARPLVPGYSAFSPSDSTRKSSNRTWESALDQSPIRPEGAESSVFSNRF